MAGVFSVTLSSVFVDGFPVRIYKILLFLCEWDSRAYTLHYLKKDWPQRKSLKGGEKNVQHPALAEWHKFLLQPLRLKLGVVKNYVKTMDRTGYAFKYLVEK
jgi:hypothetical protein